MRDSAGGVPNCDNGVIPTAYFIYIIGTFKPLPNPALWRGATALRRFPPLKQVKQCGLGGFPHEQLLNPEGGVRVRDSAGGVPYCDNHVTPKAYFIYIIGTFKPLPNPPLLRGGCATARVGFPIVIMA